MYQFECLTKAPLHCEECSPFWGECWPFGEGVCGPDCSPSNFVPQNASRKMNVGSIAPRTREVRDEA